MTLTIFLWLGLAFLATLPFDQLFPWFYEKARSINASLDHPRSLIRVPKTGVIQALVSLADFGKGFFIPWSIQYIFYNDILTLLAIGLTLALHLFSIWNKFKPRSTGRFLLWGVYTFMSPVAGLVYPVFYLVFSLLFNSFTMGWLLSILAMFVVIWMYGLSPVFLPGNAVIFVFLFLTLVNRLFSHFDQRDDTLLRWYESR